jgi:CHAT domain-containing protein
MVLGPASARLDARQLVVVPDGVLHYVPFGVLPDPRTGAPLVQSAEVVHLPSMTTGLMLSREERPAWTRTVAVFADPVFQPEDERVFHRSRTAAKPTAASPALRAAERDLGRLGRLAFTRHEAAVIHSLARDTGSHLALDFDATREAAVDPDLASFRFVHFATHGLINESRPELSGLVLSLVDRDGRPRDGFLTSIDTLNLRLDAELVVLSGCRTALGKDVRGEGMIGLTRAFMYAGARGTLASLWPVDDAATAELMRAFYAGMLGPRRLTPPAALREAQRHVRADARWSAPYYWGAFQLQGSWPTASVR